MGLQTSKKAAATATTDFDYRCRYCCCDGDDYYYPQKMLKLRPRLIPNGRTETQSPTLAVVASSRFAAFVSFGLSWLRKQRVGLKADHVVWQQEFMRETVLEQPSLALI